MCLTPVSMFDKFGNDLTLWILPKQKQNIYIYIPEWSHLLINLQKKKTCGMSNFDQWQFYFTPT